MVAHKSEGQTERHCGNANKKAPKPNHALQPTGAHVTSRAHSATAFPPAAHGPRHARPWLSLGSLGVATRIL